MSLSLKPSADGLSAVLQVGGVDVLKFGADTGLGGAQLLPMPTVSVSANAMTIGSKQYALDFRRVTLTDGGVDDVVGTPAPLVVPVGATLGAINAQKSSIVVLVLNNAGTLEYAVTNLAGGVDLSDTGLISTTAISAAATSAGTVYSNAAMTNVPYRVVGRIDSTQAIAGQWASAPSLVQGAGGQSLTVMSALGYGQKWLDVKASRAFGTTYYNTTGRPISVNVAGYSSVTAYTIDGYVNGVKVPGSGWASSTPSSTVGVSFIVPPGSNYSVSISAGSTTLGAWAEMR